MLAKNYEIKINELEIKHLKKIVSKTEYEVK